MPNARQWDMGARTCRYCSEVHQYPAGAQACEALRVPDVPAFGMADRFRLEDGVFRELYPKSDPRENLFAIAGELSKPVIVDGKASREVRARTMNCAVFLDKAAGAHANRIRLRWLGEEGNTKANRLIMVAEKDVVKITK